MADMFGLQHRYAANHQNAQPQTGAWAVIKEFFYPATATERKQRHQIFRNVCIFGGVAIGIVVFEQKLQTLMDFTEKEMV